MNIFFKDLEAKVNGSTYPLSWTETVTEARVDPDTQEETQIEVTRLSGAFADYPKRPDVCGTYQGKTVFYLAMDANTEAEQLRVIKDSGAYLCSSYEQMVMVDPELYRCVMECYLNGERVKLRDCTELTDDTVIYAPVKVAGVEVQDKPAEPNELFPTMVDRMSQAELYLRQLKETVKTRALAYIKEHQTCELVDLLGTITGTEGMMLNIMVPYYIEGAFKGGLIPEPTFGAFRDFVVQTPEDELVKI